LPANSKSGVVYGEFPVAVYYEDTDLSGFVYHSNYLKFCERARTALVGATFLRDARALGMHFVVAHAEVSFFAPACYADELVVKTSGAFSFSPVQIYTQTIYRGATKLVTATIKIATLNLENRPMRLPQAAFDHLVGISARGP